LCLAFFLRNHLLSAQYYQTASRRFGAHCDVSRKRRDAHPFVPLQLRTEGARASFMERSNKRIRKPASEFNHYVRELINTCGNCAAGLNDWRFG